MEIRRPHSFYHNDSIIRLRDIPCVMHTTGSYNISTWLKIVHFVSKCKRKIAADYRNVFIMRMPVEIKKSTGWKSSIVAYATRVRVS